MRVSFVLIFYSSLIFIVLMLGFIAPFLAAAKSPLAGHIYALFKPLDHQHPGRSYCFTFENSSFSGIEKCYSFDTGISEFGLGEVSYVSKPYPRIKDDIGRNRVEHFFSEGKEGWKMPYCSRDLGIYLGALIGILLALRGFGVNVWEYIILLLPMAVDGLWQLFTDYESTHEIRLLTGFMAGVGTSILIFSVYKEKGENGKNIRIKRVGGRSSKNLWR